LAITLPYFLASPSYLLSSFLLGSLQELVSSCSLSTQFRSIVSPPTYSTYTDRSIPFPFFLAVWSFPCSHLRPCCSPLRRTAVHRSAFHSHPGGLLALFVPARASDVEPSSLPESAFSSPSLPRFLGTARSSFILRRVAISADTSSWFCSFIFFHV